MFKLRPDSFLNNNIVLLYHSPEISEGMPGRSGEAPGTNSKYQEQ